MSYLPEGVPLPRPTLDDAPFWESAREHRLVVQRCTACGTFRHPPTPCCYKCRSFHQEWVAIDGRGIVFSYTIVTHPPLPILAKTVPYNVVVVELPDAGNVRMVGNVVDAACEDLYVGMPVRVTFEDIDDKTTLPQWRRDIL